MSRFLPSPSFLTSWLIVTISLAGGCREAEFPRLPESALRPSTTPPGAPLFLYYPQLDQRIVRLNPRHPRQRKTFYPDLWNAEVRAIRDFAVDGQRLYALLATWDRSDDGALYVIDLATGQLRQTLPLPQEPATLSWIAPGRLAICHATASHGALGRLSIVSVVSDKVTLASTIPLQGACQSVVAGAHGERQAFVLERRTHHYPEGAVVHYRLVALNLQKGGARRATRELPLGARQLALGPGGLLYIPFASGSGLSATDATVGVYDPATLKLLVRLRLQMVARAIESNRGDLVLNLMREGESWLGVIDTTTHQTHFDLRFGRLAADQLAVVDGVAYIPLRGAHALERIDLKAAKRLPRLNLGDMPQGHDVIGLLRTARHFDAPAPLPGTQAVPKRGGHAPR